MANPFENKLELKEYLDQMAERYEDRDFIKDDPIQIPHRFSREQDIEIAGFLTATIAWGNRKSIIKSASKMMDLMDRDPYNFIQDFKESDLKPLMSMPIHRTFNGEDFAFFCDR